MDAPTTFRAGDSAAWTASFPDYPHTAGWSLRYRLLPQSGVTQDIPAAPHGSDYAVALTGKQTADWSVGMATLVTIVENAEERITLGTKQVEVLPNLAEACEHDSRTRNQRALDDLEKALADYAAAGQGHVEEYEVAGRRMKFRSIDEIQKLIDWYRREVARETALLNAMAGGAPRGRVYYRC